MKYSCIELKVLHGDDDSENPRVERQCLAFISGSTHAVLHRLLHVCRENGSLNI